MSKQLNIPSSQKLDYSKEELVKQFKFVLIQSHRSLQTFSHKYLALWIQII